MLMHDATLTNRVNCGKEHDFPQKGAASLGYSSISLVLAGADFEEIKACKFKQLLLGVELGKITNLANETGNGYQAESFHGKDQRTIRNLFKLVYCCQLFLYSTLPNTGNSRVSFEL